MSAASRSFESTAFSLSVLTAAGLSACANMPGMGGKAPETAAEQSSGEINVAALDPLGETDFQGFAATGIV